MLVTCPECGAKISEDTDPCPKCGLPEAGERSEYGKQHSREISESIEKLHEMEGEIESYCLRFEKQIQDEKNYFYWEEEKELHPFCGCCSGYYRILKIEDTHFSDCTDSPGIEVKCKCLTCGGWKEIHLSVPDMENFLKELTTEPPEVRKRRTIKLIIIVLVILSVFLLVIKWLL